MMLPCRRQPRAQHKLNRQEPVSQLCHQILRDEIVSACCITALSWECGGQSGRQGTYTKFQHGFERVTLAQVAPCMHDREQLPPGLLCLQL